mmetsp:Transcript_51100/g.98856  ORF Transcript_51100/g.98856 Transcript_51100/m.98856 type:complete len:268 (+) Transcript_51100:1085-1888(+)
MCGEVGCCPGTLAIVGLAGWLLLPTKFSGCCSCCICCSGCGDICCGNCCEVPAALATRGKFICCGCCSCCGSWLPGGDEPAGSIDGVAPAPVMVVFPMAQASIAPCMLLCPTDATGAMDMMLRPGIAAAAWCTEVAAEEAWESKAPAAAPAAAAAAAADGVAAGDVTDASLGLADGGGTLLCATRSAAGCGCSPAVGTGSGAPDFGCCNAAGAALANVATGGEKTASEAAAAGTGVTAAVAAALPETPGRFGQYFAACKSNIRASPS